MPLTIVGQLRRDEAVRYFPYHDTVGKITIGVGRNLSDVGVSDLEINFMLANDIQKVTDQLTAHFAWFKSLDIARQGVLINMAFNMGFAGLCRFQSFLGFVEQGDWENARREMFDSAWAVQVKDRATRLAQQMVTGEWV